LGKDAVSPNWFITLEATDSKGETGTKTKPLTVLNHVPTTAIHGKQDVLIRQTHSYQSGGADLDSEDNGHLTYFWKVTAPDGTETEPTGSTISLTFTQGGTYKLEHWVIDPVGDSSNVAQLLVSVDDNKPPVPGFTVTPNPAYRGDPVDIVSTASDPDGIIVKHDYWISGPGIEQHWTSSPDWNRMYSTLGSYTIRQRVEDNKGAAAEASQVLQVINRLPTVELTTPSGPDIDHPSVNIPPYRAEWTYADLDGDLQQSWHFRIYEAVSDRLMIQGSGSGTTSGFHVTPGVLVGGTTYYAVVTVSDGYDSVTSAPKYFILNRPPVADFDWNPKPTWEGDTITITNHSTDPDGDVLSSSWEILGPGGYQKKTTTQNASILGWETVDKPGLYAVRLTVTDPFGAESSITKQIQVGQLTISGQVNHTPQWEINRQTYNAANPGDERSIETFWAGEQFDLIGVPTNTGTSSTVATSISVSAARIGTTALTRQTVTNWTGYIGTDNAAVNLEELEDGPHDFTFTVTYSNGVQKSTSVTIYVAGNWTDYFRLHRLY
jgi:hypothetical protein